MINKKNNNKNKDNKNKKNNGKNEKKGSNEYNENKTIVYTLTKSNDQIKIRNSKINALIKEIHKSVFGQDELIIKTIIALISNAHILIEGVPGLAKTLLISSFAKAMNLEFNRIQFTPDLLPSDIIGTEIINKDRQFITRKGPIFANLILADEINRAPPKVQSALLEAMQEKQVTIGKTSYLLDKPFFVFATQNPIENQGTYPLPEAELDRFMFKILVDYPEIEDEMKILEQYSSNKQREIKPIISKEEIIDYQQQVKNIYIDAVIQEYIAKIVDATRNNEKYKLNKLVAFGASPRASIYLAIGAKAIAWLNNRKYVIPNDIKIIAKEVLRHRIILTYDAQIEHITPDEIITQILNTVDEP